MGFQAFGQCFRQFLDTALQKPKKKYVKELSLSFPYLKTEFETPTGSFFIVFLFRPIVEIVRILFRPHCIISASIQDFELKLRTQTKFDTLISNLKLNFQHDVVMMP